MAQEQCNELIQIIERPSLFIEMKGGIVLIREALNSWLLNLQGCSLHKDDFVNVSAK
jgi:hypothetical protein